MEQSTALGGAGIPLAEIEDATDPAELYEMCRMFQFDVTGVDLNRMTVSPGGQPLANHDGRQAPVDQEVHSRQPSIPCNYYQYQAYCMVMLCLSHSSNCCNKLATSEGFVCVHIVNILGWA